MMTAAVWKRKCLPALPALLCLMVLGSCASSVRYSSASDQQGAISTGPAVEPRRTAAPAGETLRGYASYYADKFHGRRTASGETFDQQALTAAHRSLPFGTRVRVRNLSNDRTVEVVINDRGPFVQGRIIDLSRAAAEQLNMIADGVVPVELVVLR